MFAKGSRAKSPRMASAHYVPARGSMPAVTPPMLSARARRGVAAGALLVGGGTVLGAYATAFAFLLSSADDAGGATNPLRPSTQASPYSGVTSQLGDLIDNRTASAVFWRATIVGAVSGAIFGGRSLIRAHHRARSDRALWESRNDAIVDMRVDENGVITLELSDASKPYVRHTEVFVELDTPTIGENGVQKRDRTLWVVPLHMGEPVTIDPTTFVAGVHAMPAHWRRVPSSLGAWMHNLAGALEVPPQVSRALDSANLPPSAMATRWSDGGAQYTAVHPGGDHGHGIYADGRSVSPTKLPTSFFGSSLG